MASLKFCNLLPEVCHVCKHKKLVFLGKQQIDVDGKEYLALFNCNFCHTTISLRMDKKKGRPAGKK